MSFTSHTCAWLITAKFYGGKHFFSIPFYIGNSHTTASQYTLYNAEMYHAYYKCTRLKQR